MEETRNLVGKEISSLDEKLPFSRLLESAVFLEMKGFSHAAPRDLHIP